MLSKLHLMVVMYLFKPSYYESYLRCVELVVQLTQQVFLSYIEVKRI
jgi:hypothetical protein